MLFEVVFFYNSITPSLVKETVLTGFDPALRCLLEAPAGISSRLLVQKQKHEPHLLYWLVVIQH